LIAVDDSYLKHLNFQILMTTSIKCSTRHCR